MAPKEMFCFDSEEQNEHFNEAEGRKMRGKASR